MKIQNTKHPICETEKKHEFFENSNLKSVISYAVTGKLGYLAAFRISVMCCYLLYY